MVVFRNLKIPLIFSSTEQVKCTIASLIHAGTRLDRDENHVMQKPLSFSEYSLLDYLFSHRHSMTNFFKVFPLCWPIRFVNYAQQRTCNPIRIVACKHDHPLDYHSMLFLLERAFEAKTMVCLEVMQVFILCPVFYTMISNPSKLWHRYSSGTTIRVLQMSVPFCNKHSIVHLPTKVSGMFLKVSMSMK